MMSVFWKSVAGVLIALILWLCLEKHNKDISLLLTLAVCAMIIITALSFLHPIVSFLQKIQKIGNIDSDLYTVLIKAVGIGVLSELSALVCKDAGNDALGKTLQLLASSVILWMAIPLFNTLISLIEDILKTV